MSSILSSISSDLGLVECLVTKCGRTAFGKRREERNVLQVFICIIFLAVHDL